MAIGIWRHRGNAGLQRPVLFCVLLLMALGLAIIFGQMGVINMAHGEFMTIGAYTIYLCSSLTAHFAPASALLLLLRHRPVVPRCLRRRLAGGVGADPPLYKRPLDTLLATWGLSLVMQQTFRSVFGAREVSATCRTG
jgi:urea transport system permease protein